MSADQPNLDGLDDLDDPEALDEPEALDDPDDAPGPDDSPVFARHTAAVAIPRPVLAPYHYAVPDALHDTARVGCRVRVRFGRRTTVGYIVERDTPPPPGIGLRPIEAILDDEQPTFTPELIEFVRWLADYYHAPLGEALRGAHPAGTNPRGLPALALTPLGRDAARAGDPALQALALADGPLPLAALDLDDATLRRFLAHGWIQRTDIIAPPRVEARTRAAWRAIAPPPATPRGPGGRPLRRDEIHAWLIGRGAVPLADIEAHYAPARAHLTRLVTEGTVAAEEIEVIRDPFFGEPVPRDRPRKLNPGQRRAVDAITAATGYHGYLLHGITGSGKTEVYLHAIAATLARGRGALVLVPEIALTPQLAHRFRARFGDDLAVLHSGLGDGARYDMWRRLRRGEVRLAIGARSAVFAPVADLGLIIVDEEHDPSFKQHDGVRYHGRDMALLRGQRAGAAVVLGTATPSLESLHNWQDGKLTLLTLTERPTGGVLPRVELIDLTTAPPPDDRETWLSLPLREALQQTLDRAEQAIVFLNRRGFSSYAQCAACGVVIECDQCAIAMTWHKARRQLRCHYCDAARPLPPRCPACDRPALTLPGRGTEKVEEHLRALHPAARIARLDRDTASGRALEETLAAMRDRRLDILVGTQMVTKGHDFPHVTLVGVLDADAGLHFPDLRAAERTFQLLAQVAGRAGRSTHPGRVLIQTRSPRHPCLQAAIGHDHAAFAAVELAERQRYGWPPYTHLAVLRFEGRDLPRVTELAERTTRLLRAHAPEGITLRGPAPAVIDRLRGRSRWVLMLTARHRAPLHRLLHTLDTAALPRAGDPRLIIDVDAHDLM
ncbi:MAG: primosomal protein N' [bacterium]